MAVVDFTDYTEQDLSGEITITSSRVTFTTMAIDETAYVTKSYGAGFFGDFVHRQKIQFDEATNNASGSSGRNLVWALSATANHTRTDMITADEGMHFHLVRSGGTYTMMITDIVNSNNDFYILAAPPPFTCWVEIERSGTTLTVKVYSDAYSTLIDTLSVVCSASTYEYHTAIGSSDEAADPDTITGYIESFDSDPDVVAPAVVAIKKNFHVTARPIRNMYGDPSTGMGSNI